MAGSALASNFRVADQIYLPAGGHFTGSRGETWLTDVWISNVNSDSVVWSRDGKFLVMVTGQRTEETKIARISLVPATPKFREEQFRDLFQETKPAESKPSSSSTSSD